MSDAVVDVSSVRALGEEVYRALFPPQRPDGRQPYPTPIRVAYQIDEETTVSVRLTMERTVHVIGEEPSDVRASKVFVVWGDVPFVTDLKFGEEPLVPSLDDDFEQGALTSLLRAVTGVL